jgi:hypothetical protein
MGASVRAKFQVSFVQRHADNVGGISHELVQLNAATTGSEANKQWSRWTPAGNLSLTINNPDCFGKFLPGQFYFLDFTLTDKDGI